MGRKEYQRIARVNATRATVIEDGRRHLGQHDVNAALAAIAAVVAAVVLIAGTAVRARVRGRCARSPIRLFSRSVLLRHTLTPMANFQDLRQRAGRRRATRR